MVRKTRIEIMIFIKWIDKKKYIKNVGGNLQIIHILYLTIFSYVKGTKKKVK
jgi:hypothetical protein